MTINILGQDYDMQETNAKDDVRMTDLDGYCDCFGKTIRINNDFNENNPACISNLPMYKQRVMRHEIIHAFFEESGLKEYKGDELIVEWIACQFSKMEKAFQQAGAL